MKVPITFLRTSQTCLLKHHRRKMLWDFLCQFWFPPPHLLFPFALFGKTRTPIEIRSTKLIRSSFSSPWISSRKKKEKGKREKGKKERRSETRKQKHDKHKPERHDSTEHGKKEGASRPGNRRKGKEGNPQPSPSQNLLLFRPEIYWVVPSILFGNKTAVGNIDI